MITADPKQSRVQRIAVVVGLLIAGLVTYMVTRPKPVEAAMDTPAGTVYYKGPMQGKGGKTGTDDLNPDLADTSKH